jgi:D-alanyl-D-alanine carboxypeptidase/D-alanyl-D-alanine-endopeptidase (penicillin-binding protein 4)
VVLVGGGDPSLTDQPIGPATYPRPATLDSLAVATARALRAKGIGAVTLHVDDSLFSGPRTAPGWQPSYLPSGVVAPVSALVVDEGRRRPGTSARVTDPALSAGQAFARRLAAHGVRVTGTVGRGAAPADPTELAHVDSPPLSALVESMLARSDNDYAEALARHVAVAEQLPATFAGVAAAIPRALTALDVDQEGLTVADGSGLSRSSRAPPQVLADVLRAAWGPDHPELRPIMSGLPVAGFSGTLLDRFGAPTDRPAIGTVRAKTGTLTGVSGLAGVVVDADGAPLVFVLMSDAVPVPRTLAARAALDLAATRLAACGCR